MSDVRLSRLTWRLVIAFGLALGAAQALRAQAPARWPGLAGRVGPYGGILNVADAQRMTGDGLTLTVLSNTAAPVLEALRNGGATYIDVTLWELIHSRCVAQTAGRDRRACVLTRGDSDAIVQEASAHVRKMESDPGLAGFWILDDYPGGDVSSTLVRLREVVSRSNQTSGFRRATICGVGGSLDAKASASASTFVANHGYFDRAVANISPDACDIVAPYFYGTAASNDPDLIDWSMRDLLPYFRRKLESRGFDPSAAIILPVVHAFSFKSDMSPTFYVMPRPDDVAAQMKAYCEAGALGTLFFTWASRDADQSYSNNPAIRAGVEQGRRQCERTR